MKTAPQTNRLSLELSHFTERQLDHRMCELPDEWSSLEHLVFEAGYPSPRAMLSENNMWSLTLREVVKFLVKQLRPLKNNTASKVHFFWDTGAFHGNAIVPFTDDPAKAALAAAGRLAAKAGQPLREVTLQVVQPARLIRRHMAALRAGNLVR